MTARPPWQGFVDAAIGVEPGGGPVDPLSVPACEAHDQPVRSEDAGRNLPAKGFLARGKRLFARDATATQPAVVRRADLRLVPAAAFVWGSAAAGAHSPPAVLAVLTLGLLGTGAVLIYSGTRRHHPVPDGPARSGRHRGRPRSLALTLAVALVLAAAAAAHAAVASGARSGTALAALVAKEASVVALVEVTGLPRQMGPGSFPASPTEQRWRVPATIREVTAEGTRLRNVSAAVRISVIGGGAWSLVGPGQLLRATGVLSAADHGGSEAAVLSAASALQAGAPGADAAFHPWASSLLASLQDVRRGYGAAAASLPPDARGLLPGMVTGDTSALDPELKMMMRTVGLSHLTAVSGANCSLVIGALLMAARTMRLRRGAAAMFALGGLALFVGLVGPDPSVVRAACMGFIAVWSLAAGRPGRGLSLLCLAVLALLLVEPPLATDFGFLLSVAATLGIVLLAGPMMRWACRWVPPWLAALVAVPLSAQVFCGPVVVVLQPAYSTYALAANILSAPLVPPVTILGTAAVPFVHAAPWLTALLNMPAGLCSVAIAAIARFLAGRPDASLPWPEGPVGVLSMCLLSVLSVLAAWAVLNPSRTVRFVLVLHSRTEVLLDKGEGLWQVRRSGLVRASRRGNLGTCINTFGRNQPWPDQQKSRQRHRPRTWSRGAMWSRPPSSSSAAPRNTSASGPWIPSGPGSGLPRRTWRSPG